MRLSSPACRVLPSPKGGLEGVAARDRSLCVAVPGPLVARGLIIRRWRPCFHAWKPIEEEGAPDWVIDTVARLEPDRTFTSVGEAWEAAGRS